MECKNTILQREEWVTYLGLNLEGDSINNLLGEGIR